METADPAPSQKAAPGLAWGLLAAVFPLAVFAAGTFFLFGDLGKWTDDWYYIQRDPGTGEVQGLFLQKPVHVFRPLFRATISTLQTLLWKDDWANHLISAAAHGLAGLVLWRLLLSMGFTRLSAGVGALFFALYPVHFEVVFWCGALPTTLGLTVALGAIALGLRYARGDAGAWAVAGVGALAFASASFNEQPALIIGALPLLGLAVRRDGDSARRVFLRGVGGAACAGVALVVYVVIHRAMGLPRPAIDRDAMMVSPERMWGALKGLLYWGRGRHLLHDFSRPAFELGVAELRAFPARAAVFGAVILAGLVAWVARHRRRGDERPAGVRLPRVLPMLGGAGTIFVVGWSPVVALDYWLMPRMAYAPTVGLAMMLALGLDVAARHTEKNARVAAGWRVAVAVVSAAVAVWFAVMLIGVQGRFRDRARKDLAEVGALRAMVPDPAPGSVFMPVRIEPPPLRERAGAFDAWFESALNNWWSAKWIVQFQYGRGDVNAGCAPWALSGLIEARPEAAVVRSVGDVAWDRVIPFEIDSRGRVRLIERVVVERADGTRAEFEAAQVRRVDAAALERAGFARPGTFVQSSP